MVAAKGMDTATSILAARLVAPSRGRSCGPDRLASDSSDATTSDTVGSPEGDSLAEPGSLAFQAWLVPAPAPDPQPAGQESRGAGDAAGGQRAALETASGWNGGRAGSRSIREADPGFAGAETVAHSVSMVAPVPSNAGEGAPGAQSTNAHPHQVALPAPADLSAWDPPKPGAGGAARAIQLELRDADARVNVRLVERAGSIEVDVRTPDSHLAGSLRDDLPALTARLEQTGLRAETWHDAPATARIRMAEPAASAGFQSSENQSRREGGGRGPRDGQPQEKRQNRTQTGSKEFSWLFMSQQ